MNKKFVSVGLALVLALSLCLVTAVPVAAQEDITIDGVLEEGEWDAHYLGTSVTDWEGSGMSVDVYGFADDTYLYAAYEADMNQPGWSVGAGLGVSNNLSYWTPSTADWPDLGHTLLAAGGYPADVLQTDGNGWTNLPGSFADNDIDIYSGDGMYNTDPNPNVAEVKIPLSLLTYAGTDGQIGLGGQYWQNDQATPFFVMLPPPPPSEVWVDDDLVVEDGTHFKTIQGGIAAVDLGGTVHVAAGIYNEQVNITKAVNLLGAQHGVDARMRPGTPETDSVISHSEGPIDISADNVVIDGFTIQDASARGGIHATRHLYSGYKIINNIIKNNGYGLYLSTNGVYQTVVQFNLFENNNLPGPCSGDAIYSEDNTSNVLIDSNKFTGHNMAAAVFCDDGPHSGIIISNNEMVSDNSITLVNVVSSSITGNTFTDSQGTAIFIGGGVDGLVITGNTIQNGIARAIWVTPDIFGYPNPNANIEVHHNNIEGNALGGIEVEPGRYVGTLDATNNWWGHASGPSGGVGDPVTGTIASGDGDKVSGNVCFDPWTGKPPTDDTTTEGEVAGVTSITPNFGDIDTTLTVTITGGGFKAEGDATVVSFGEGITATILEVFSDTQITAQLSIADNAVAGARNVTVTVPAGKIIGSGLFTVLESLTLTAPSNISLGLMVPGAPATGQSIGDAAGTVVTNVKTWSVVAVDAKTEDKGFMVTAGGDPLHNLFDISADGSAYLSASTGITYTGAYDLPFYVSQFVATNDPIGSYAITITFIAAY